MLVRILKREAVRGGRKHVRTVMKRIGIATLYSKLNTHCRQSKHKIWPFLLGGMTINRANQVWARRRHEQSLPGHCFAQAEAASWPPRCSGNRHAPQWVAALRALRSIQLDAVFTWSGCGGDGGLLPVGLYSYRRWCGWPRAGMLSPGLRTFRRNGYRDFFVSRDRRACDAGLAMRTRIRTSTQLAVRRGGP